MFERRASFNRLECYSLDTDQKVLELGCLGELPCDLPGISGGEIRMRGGRLGAGCLLGKQALLECAPGEELQLRFCRRPSNGSSRAGRLRSIIANCRKAAAVDAVQGQSSPGSGNDEL